MTDEEVFVYIQHMATLRSSAQSRKAVVQKETGSKKKSSVDLAKDLLSQILSS